MPGPAAAPGSREQLFAIAALGTIILVTFGWWALALWPVPEEGAEWLLRTRAVCFGSTGSGLPDAEGWALLIGQPLSMVAVLLIGWPRATRAGLLTLARSLPGRALVTATVVALGLGLTGASVRVAGAVAESREPLLDAPTATADELRRLDLPAPTGLELVDQSGMTFDLSAYRGRPVLVTFAFAHCETVCPVLVREVLAAQAGAAGRTTRPAVVVVTVDPWRDTPTRLPHVAHQWELDADAHVLSGAVDAVTAELEAWDVNIRRDPRTGDVTHPALVYVLDADGRIAFATTGGGDHAIGLLERLETERE